MIDRAKLLRPTRGTAAGVPYIALPPANGAAPAPLMLAWHLGSPPRSEAAMAAALPLEGLAAWRVYLGLPMLGSRLPAGGLDEFFRRFREDMVLGVFDPVVREAVEELPAALAELRDLLPIADGPVGLVGGSTGAWVAQTVLADTDLPVSAVALVSPAIRASSVVARYERMWDFAYPWSERSRAVADRLDFVARAGEIADRRVATLVALGAHDDEQAFHEPATRLREALVQHSSAPTSLVRIPGMEHALAAEPGLEPAPQSQAAAAVDRLITDWFRRHLTSTAWRGRTDANAARGRTGVSPGRA